MRIADVHAHIFPDSLAEKAAVSIGKFYGGYEMFQPGSVGHLLEAERNAGVSRCVVSSSAVTPKQACSINTFIAEACAENPMFIGFGTLFPGMEGYDDELDRMQALGLVGLKIHPDFQKVNIDDPCGIDMYRSIARRGLPVLFHMGDDRFDYSSPERLTNLLRQAPDLRVIAAHFGGWNSWERSLAHPQPENVVYDTCSSTPLLDTEMTLRLIDTLGAHRILFGTDFPMWEPKKMVQEILALGLDENTRDAIFYGNFMKFFGLEP